VASRRRFHPTAEQESAREQWLRVLNARLPRVRFVCYFGAIWAGTMTGCFSSDGITDTYEKTQAQVMNKNRERRAAGTEGTFVYRGIYSPLLDDLTSIVEEA
jgi:hypothetical protein